MYIWQQPTWPDFTWDNTALSTLLAQANNKHTLVAKPAKTVHDGSMGEYLIGQLFAKYLAGDLIIE